MTKEEFIEEVKKISPMFNSLKGEDKIPAGQILLAAGIGLYIRVCKVRGLSDPVIKKAISSFTSTVLEEYDKAQNPEKRGLAQ